MAQMTNKKRTILIAVTLASVLLMSIYMTYGSSDTFSWENIFGKIGLSETTTTQGDKYPCSVYFIDIGQGDSELIVTDDMTVLVDAGERDAGAKVVEQLEALKIKTIDYLVATHPHSDHIGGMKDVFASCEIKNIIIPRLTKINTPTTSTYETFLKLIKGSGADVLAANPMDVYSAGDTKITILAPIKQVESLNDMSIVFRLDYMDVSFLFTGDAEKNSEKLMLSKYEEYLDTDVLKVGHHGSRNASTKNFLAAVTPELAVISCANGNDYGHPHEEAVKRLNNINAVILRTDQSGTVVISTDGKKLYY